LGKFGQIFLLKKIEKKITHITQIYTFKKIPKKFPISLSKKIGKISPGKKKKKKKLEMNIISNKIKNKR